MSLIEPFLADIEDASRWLLATFFSISGFPWEPADFDERGNIREETPKATRAGRFPGQKWQSCRDLANARCSPKPQNYGSVRPAPRRSRPRVRAWPAGGAGGASGVPWTMPVKPLRPACAILRSTRSSAAAQDPIAAGLAADFLAGQAQRALLVAVIDVPHPGDHGLAADHLRREIGAHAIGGRAFARHDREVAQLGFAVEHADHALEHGRRRAVDRFEGHGRSVAGHANEAPGAPPLAQPPSAPAAASNSDTQPARSSARLLRSRTKVDASLIVNPGVIAKTAIV